MQNFDRGLGLIISASSLAKASEEVLHYPSCDFQTEREVCNLKWCSCDVSCCCCVRLTSVLIELSWAQWWAKEGLDIQ